ncbi:protein kinase domain-containing protein [Stieleria varia]|uniref:Tubulin-like protein n=1 Tax=Stieleria varia TaxID=2528005 RepID=A0A5C6A047_9BACT|nr:tubulin-like doman-containing protein [Stieleria varia]TWT92775.1 Tubulin-like protein [Stieleria varia]
MKTETEKKIQPGYEPISGYVLEQLIGRGGYGEVWRAVAPGGLKKAVKFVFGQHDEHRAQQELKSLERIKCVQHPFILTLERFELIDNQLVIVTELADGSLEDIFQQHRDRGSCGIPRAALLSYLKDTADALDYLHQLYQLQHLDIKPANLLIVGGHVKVADFGLLKDLGESDCSLVGGLTPIYAPPELFDGRPSMHSDQYSLAVMYQELVSGVRPFTGRTIAQLATQHVHNAPNLESLPAADRPIVARALEKSPERRFGSCTEFVSKLTTPRSTPSVSSSHESEPPQEPTEHRVEDLPQLQAASGLKHGIMSRDALVIALGGTGADILHALRRRVAEMHSAPPVRLHSVLIDTDPIALQAAKVIEPTDWMPGCRVIDTPLRRATEYRERGTEHLRTLSRRWIYNIPRSGTTEGMRPLGRLALVDHAAAVTRGIKNAIAELKSDGDEDDLSIYVVGSLSGGTGSGMYIDVVHLLRYLLDDAGLERLEIISLLTTNRMKGDPNRVLGLHGTHAALHEMMHFMKIENGYPGDPGAGWPSIPAARTPLKSAYLFPQSDAQGARSPREIATEYLWADATACGHLLETGRRLVESDDLVMDQPQIRSASMVWIGDARRVQAGVLAQPTTRLLLMQWLGDPKSAAELARPVVDRTIRRSFLNHESWIKQSLQYFGKDRADRRTALMEHLRTITPDRLSIADVAHAETVKWLQSIIDGERELIAVQEITRNIQHEISIRLQDRRMNLASAIEALSTLENHIASMIPSLIEQAESALPAAPHSGSNQTLPSSLGNLRVLRTACDRGETVMQAVAARLAADTAHALKAELSKLKEDICDGAAKVALAISRLSEDTNQRGNPWDTMDGQSRSQFQPLLESLHARASSQWLIKLAGPNIQSVSVDAMNTAISGLAMSLIGELLEHLGSERIAQSMESDSRLGLNDSGSGKETAAMSSVGSDSIGMTGTHSLSENRETTSAPVPLNMSDALVAVRPPLLQCGGKQRLFLVCSSDNECEKFESEIRQSHEGTLTTFVARSAASMLIHEAQQIPLDRVIRLLGSVTGDDGRISGRLHARTDVQFDKP